MFSETKVTEEELSSLQNFKKYHVFFSTAHPDSSDEQSGTGDVDYTQALADTINSQKWVRQNACYIRGIFDEKVIYEFIKKHAANHSPILQVMINAPRTGFAFTVEGLTRFKQLGGQLVVTAVEFAKHQHHSYQITTLEYLKIADQIIFLDEFDKEAAIEFQKEYLGSDWFLFNKLQSAEVISVPPTIPSLVETPAQRGEIISFGMIRVGKGLAHVIKLARLIKKEAETTPTSKMANKKVLVVGTVQSHVENKAFADLLSELYPEKAAEIKPEVVVDGRRKYKTGVELKALWEKYKAEGLTPTLSIELHIDVPKDELALLFKRCTYAYLPAYRGVTFRNSSISSAIAQGFVTYSHIDEITPEDLRPGGQYHHALVLSEDDDYQTYADQVFNDILKRESEVDATSNLVTKQNAKQVLDEKLSRVLIGNTHRDIYEKLAKNAKVAPFAFQWQEAVKKKRAYNIMTIKQGFNIEARSQQNLKALKSRLKMATDPGYTQEMRDFLAANKTADSVLTPKESQLFTAMLKRKWVLKHATDFVSEMQKNRMLSLEERTQRGMNTSNAHTNPMEGHSDNVFFTYGPGNDLETVRFLDSAQSVITADAELLRKNSQRTWSGTPKSLYGMWGSDHFYAYSAQQDPVSITFGDCRYSVFYRDLKDKETGVHFVKFCQYDRRDGSSATQQFERGEEVFTYPKIDQGILLSVIEKARLMGYKAWDLVMNQMSLEQQEKFVQTLYHTGVFEVHKPRSFSLNQLGVEIITRESKEDADNTSLCTFSIIEAAYKGDSKLVLEFCQNNQNFSKISGKVCNGTFKVDLLGAAILGGHTELVQALLNVGIFINTDDNTICIQDANGGSCTYPVSVLALALCLSNPRQDFQLQPNPKAAREILELLIKTGAVDRRNAAIRHPLTITIEDIERGFEFLAEPSDMLYLLEILEKQLNFSRLKLERAVNTRSLALVTKMLDLKVKTATWQEESSYGSLNRDGVERGMTPLLVAVGHGDTAMVELLLSRGAPLEQAFCVARTMLEADEPITYEAIHPFEGYTALLMAIEKRHLALVKLLLAKGANVLHRSATGKAAISIATEKGDEAIQSVIRKALEEIKETIDLQMGAKGSNKEEAKIQHDYTRIILTGKEAGKERFFLVDCRENGARFSPFILSIPTRKMGVEGVGNPQEIIAEINRNLNVVLQPTDISWASIPTLSCYISGSEAHYTDNVIVCEVRDLRKIQIQLSSRKYDGLKRMIAADFRWEASGKYPRNQNPWFPKIAHALFEYVDKIFANNNVNMCEQEHSALNVCYQETLKEQYQVMEAAKRGDIEQLKALVNQGAVLGQELPMLSASDQERLGILPSVMAWQNKHQDCALYIMLETLDINAGFSHSPEYYSIIQEVVRDGHLAFFKALHQQKHPLTNYAANPEGMNSLISDAFSASDKSLAYYIVEHCIDPNNGHFLVEMSEAAQSKQFDKVLDCLNKLPETLTTSNILEAVFNDNVVSEVVKAGHLELYKALHKKKLRCTNYGATPYSTYSICHMFGEAIVARQRELMYYIAHSISPSYGVTLGSLVDALQSQAFDLALEHLNTLPETLMTKEMLEAIFERNAVVFEIAKAGHLALYKVLYEKKLRSTNYAADPGSVGHMLSYAMAGKHRALASYILDSINPGSGEVLLEIAEMVQLKQFDLVLQKLTALPESVLVSSTLELIFNRNIVIEIVIAGYLPLYKALHEKKLCHTNYASNSHTFDYLIYSACYNKHYELVAYLLEGIVPGSGNVFSEMKKAIDADNFDSALAYFDALPSNVNKRQILQTIFNTSSFSITQSTGFIRYIRSYQLIYKVILSGHIPFYKAIHEDKHPSEVLLFLEFAIQHKQEPFALYILESFRPEEKSWQSLMNQAKEHGLVNVAAKILSFQISTSAVQLEAESMQPVYRPSLSESSRVLETKTDQQVLQVVATASVIPADVPLERPVTTSETAEKSKLQENDDATNKIVLNHGSII